MGTSSFRYNQIGNENSGLGTNSGFFSTGNVNTFVGSHSGFGVSAVLTTGSANTGVGNRSLTQITSGGQNTGVGDYALHNISDGNQNTALGAGALDYHTSGDRNTGVGMWSGRNGATPFTGSDNFYGGYNSGNFNYTGSNNTLVGSNTNVFTSNLTYASAFGSGASVNCSNCLTLGGNAAANRTRVGINNNNPAFRLHINEVSGVYGEGIALSNINTGSTWEILNANTNNFWFNYAGAWVGWINSATGAYNAISDKRLKTNIRPMETILDRVMQLKVSRYEYIKNNPSKIQSIGFIAQEVEPLFPEVVSKQETDDSNAEIKDQYGMDYAGMSVIAIKAIQEQQKIIEQLTKRIEELEKKSDK
jgi:hypothetical protein